MIIVIIHWKIKPEQEKVEEFLEFWRKAALVGDRTGLIGEFLSEGHSTKEFGWITWPLTGCERKHKSFVNVGYWNSAEEFQEQIGKYFDSSTGPKDFEAEPPYADCIEAEMLADRGQLIADRRQWRRAVTDLSISYEGCPWGGGSRDWAAIASTGRSEASDSALLCDKVGTPKFV